MVHALETASETEARDLYALSDTALLASRVLQAPPDEGLVREALNLIAEIDDADPQRRAAGAAAREEVRRALEALARFCREHLGAWAPAAVADLRGAATHPLYLAAADLVTALLAALRG